MAVKKERFFVRCRDRWTGKIYFDEAEGEEVFAINGFRFFIHDDRITDALSGQRVGQWRYGYEDYDAFVQRVRRTVESQFDKYLAGVKEALTITTGKNRHEKGKAQKLTLH